MKGDYEMSIRMAAADTVRVAPLGAAAWYMEFVSTYGSALLTTLGIVYAIVNITLRIKEHLERRKEKKDESSK